MASVFRRTKKRPLPAGAEVTEKVVPLPKGARVKDGVASWHDSRGLRREGVVVDGELVRVLQAKWNAGGSRGSAPVTHDGRNILALSGSYIVMWLDHTGKRRTASTGTTDKDTAKRIAAQKDAHAALRREGVVDPRLEVVGQQSSRPLSEHLADFEAGLRVPGRGWRQRRGFRAAERKNVELV